MACYICDLCNSKFNVKNQIIDHFKDHIKENKSESIVGKYDLDNFIKFC